ncbi:non-hypothetical protein [Azotobacter vinelandii CA]|uniref:Uncharacterized protein n=3 Tax=Azotobacter group TaxID=351 RepID=C1DEG4_AZOVD|nr:non-conserved hypothetical protein [Azotobacter vinelandii DJ]AGK15115.1 non-hypothetical protein [Azotobacter vinelandii CA]AGK20290.1 non-hypothetical protein [Azotobacter vinelandii CA6]
MIDQNYSPNLGVVLRNLFALGCLLASQGRIKEGLRVCHDVINALDQSGSNIYLGRLMAALLVDPVRIAREVGPSRELLSLFPTDKTRKSGPPTAG